MLKTFCVLIFIAILAMGARAADKPDFPIDVAAFSGTAV